MQGLPNWRSGVCDVRDSPRENEGCTTLSLGVKQSAVGIPPSNRKKKERLLEIGMHHFSFHCT